MTGNIVFADNFDALASENISQYCTHALCHNGTTDFTMAAETHRMKKGDCIIFPDSELVSIVETSRDFDATVVYLFNPFVFENLPRNDYDVVGKLTLLRNPVMALTAAEQAVFMNDVQQIKQRIHGNPHHFINELTGSLARVFILDLYDFHYRIYSQSGISKQTAILADRFIEMLKGGAYMEHRNVAYYASQLCVTPKYLSEVCKNISGFSANFWIDRFTIAEITRLLSRKELAIKEISDRMGFSSISYFSRYVLRILKITPSEFRSFRHS